MHQALSHAELIALFREEPFEFAPGERGSYSNSGSFLLGLIVERASGQSYAEYLRENLVQPLGLERTRYCPGATGRVVSPALYREMITAGLLNSGRPTGYGYGAALGELEGHSKIAHGGGINGFSACLAHDPADSVTVAMLANAERIEPGALESAVARSALRLPQLVRKDLPLTDEKRALCLGSYDRGPLQLRVFVASDRLKAQATGQPALRMLYQGEHTFLLDVPQSIRLGSTPPATLLPGLCCTRAAQRFRHSGFRHRRARSGTPPAPGPRQGALGTERTSRCVS